MTFVLSNDPNPVILEMLTELRKRGFIIIDSTIEYEDGDEDTLREILDKYYQKLPKQ
mgnify:CR=1 FL=1